MHKGLLLIKKYKNRRLYNTETSAYINREDLLKIIQDGRDVQVQDAATSENVTIETLLQVLVSEASDVINLIPAELLHFLIRSRPGAARDFFQVMQPYLQAFLNPSKGASMGFPGFGNQPFPGMFPSFQFPGMNPSPFSSEPQGNQASEDDLEDLKERLKNLESELARSKQRKK